MGESFEAILGKHKTDLTNHNEAMSSNDANLWQGDIEVELESIYSNRVWDLVEEPKGIKPKGCKRVYKRKR